MKRYKKIISILISAVIIFSSLAAGFSALASSQELILNHKTTAVMNGAYDLEWFHYTPAKSGLYSFLSYNVPACEAYLFVRETDPETGGKKLVQLAFSNKDPDYKENNHNALQFRLTYHLEAGTRYFFAAGWMLPTQTNNQMNVMLRCDAYDDENAIERIEAQCMAEYNVCLDGNWETDATNTKYYRYNTSKMIRNTRVTLHYKNGKSTTAVGEDIIDGYNILFKDNQYENHWYPENDPRYTGNLVTIQVLDLKTQVSVKVVSGPRYIVQGAIVNMNNEPVQNAEISIDGSKLAYTDENGIFSFYMSSGLYNLTIKADNAVTRKKQIVIAAIADSNDYRGTPFTLCTCDFVQDDYVNAKDFAFATQKLSGEELEKAKREIKSAINFDKSRYEKLQ